MQWFYSKEGTQKGPVSQDELKAMIASGSVRGSDLVWREGMPNWVAASTLPELNTGAPPATSGPIFGPTNPYTPPTAAASPGQYHGQPIPNYLWQSIVVTVLCCLPFGIPAIVYASKVDGLLALGDIDGARRASDTAKMWCWISFGLWIGFAILYLLMIVAGGMSGAFNN